MNVLMLIDQPEDLDGLKGLKQYFDEVDDLHLVTLYITEQKCCLCFGTHDHPHYILDDAERAYVNDLEDRVMHEFLPWINRVHFRHEVGCPRTVISKVAREEAIDIIAVSKRQHEEKRFQQLDVKIVVFHKDEDPHVIAH